MLVLVGITSAICSNLATSIGTMLQKSAVDQNRCTITNIYSHPQWLIGALLTIVASALDFVSLAFAPVSIVGTLVVSNLVFNAMISWSKQTPTRADIGGMLCIIVGCLGIICSQTLSDGVQDNLETRDYLSQPLGLDKVAFIIAGTILSTVIGLWSTMNIAAAAAAGLVATNCLLVGRMMVDLVIGYSAGATNSDALVWWIVMTALIFVLGFSIVMQLKLLVKAFEAGSAVLECNVFSSVNIITSIIAGGALMSEFVSYNTLHWSLMAGGLFATLTGIVVLSGQDDPPMACPFNQFAIVIL